MHPATDPAWERNPARKRRQAPRQIFVPFTVLLALHRLSMAADDIDAPDTASSDTTARTSRASGSDASEADAAYVRRVQDGDRAAFRTLIDRYEGMVFDLTHQYADAREDAEDLAQDAFLRAFQRIGDLRKPDRFSSWLYGIALNRCRDYAKNVRRNTYAFSRTEEADAHVSADLTTDTGPRQDLQMMKEEQNEQVWDALQELTATYATPFLMKYRDGLTYKAMSKRLDVSVSTLKVRVHRARKKLRRLLEERNDDVTAPQ